VVDTTTGDVLLYVEVKATVGPVGNPVEISEGELQFRRRNPERHRIFIVHLNRQGNLPPRAVVELTSDEEFAISPRRYLLWPRQVE
jgi:hypothetical protein